MRGEILSTIFKLILFSLVILALVLRMEYHPRTFKKFQQAGEFTDFSGRHKCNPSNFYQPETEKQLIDFIKNVTRNQEKLRVIGAGHSMSQISMTEGNLVNLDKLNKLIAVNPNSRTITVQAGIRLKDLSTMVVKYNLSLLNVGQILEQSIAGAISTSTHGSTSNGKKGSLKYGSLSTQVLKMKIIDSKGNSHYASNNHNKDLFDAARCGLGSLGIITEVTIRCKRLKNLQIFEETRRFSNTIKNHQKILSSSEYFRFWWVPYSNNSKVISFKETKKEQFKDFKFQLSNFLAIPIAMNFISLGKLFGVNTHKYLSDYFFIDKNAIGRPHEVLSAPHPAIYSEIEYFFPIENLQKVHKEFREYVLQHQVYYNLISEIRFIAKDDIWISPFYKRDSVAISVILYDSNSIWEEYSRGIETIFMKYQGRPHWGKHHERNSTNLKTEFDRWDDFLKIRRKMDPEGTFLNDYLIKILNP
jgi:FAD/FMN-containing dehydrogenase